MEGNFLYI